MNEGTLDAVAKVLFIRRSYTDRSQKRACEVAGVGPKTFRKWREHSAVKDLLDQKIKAFEQQRGKVEADNS